MAARDVRKNFNIFFDGRGYAGQSEDYEAPKLALTTEDFRGGGMHAPVELKMGMEKLESSFSLIAYDADVLSRFDIVEGRDVQVTVREVLESQDGTTTGVVHSHRGYIKSIDPGTSKAGDKPTLKISLALSYYRLQHGARTIHEIDVPNMVHLVNGVDQLAAQRNALGIG